jgi:hypothetical protein
LVEFGKICIDLFVAARKEIESGKAKAKKLKKPKKKNVKNKLIIVASKSEDRPATTPDPHFIDVTGTFPKTHYSQLILEINECYAKGYPNATFTLSRKVVENLTFHILEKKFPSNVTYWYDTSNKRNHSLSTLIKNLYANRDQFKPNAKQYIETFNRDVGTFKKDVDAAIHNNHVYLFDTEELKPYKIHKLIQLLLDIYHSI